MLQIEHQEFVDISDQPQVKILTLMTKQRKMMLCFRLSTKSAPRAVTITSEPKRNLSHWSQYVRNLTLDSGHVRPRHATEMCNVGESSPPGFRNISPVEFSFSSGFLYGSVWRSPQNLRNLPNFRAEKHLLENSYYV